MAHVLVLVLGDAVTDAHAAVPIGVRLEILADDLPQCCDMLVEGRAVSSSGRRLVIVAVVMVLQRFEGMSDREAVDRVTFDLRWKYAAGGLDFDYAGFVQRRHGGQRARVRGRSRVTHDCALLGAAQNFRRLAMLGVHHDGSTWTR